LKLWLQNGRLIHNPDTGHVCSNENCPCGYNTTCQCLYYYYAMAGMSYDPYEEPPETWAWLTQADLEFCGAAGPYTFDTTNIYHYTERGGEGCVQVDQAMPEGWAGWCEVPTTFNCGGYYTYCILLLNTWWGNYSCRPCEDPSVTDGCPAPSSFPALPATPYEPESC
jgi:hypothetical protein